MALEHLFHVSVSGYSHSSAECQDYSGCLSYQDSRFLCCCDGHGGKKYVRSAMGALFAFESAKGEFLHACSYFSNHLLNSKTFQKYKSNMLLRILQGWNSLVLEDFRKNPISFDVGSSNQKLEESVENPFSCYGTTLSCVMQIQKKLIILTLGDSPVLLRMKNHSAISLCDEELVGQFTHSISEEDAVCHFHASLYDAEKYDAVVLCTDGLAGYYGKKEEIRRKLFPLITESMNEQKLKDLVVDIAGKSGNGDDVSLAILY